jgi:nucleotide-binding universal stress UspA family protein
MLIYPSLIGGMGVSKMDRIAAGSEPKRSKTMFKRIIVPLDGSNRAERAIPVAARIARASEGSILLLRIVTIPLEIGSQVIPLSGFSSTTLDDDINAATNYLAAIARRDELDGIGLIMEVLTGSVAHKILDVVEDEKADLVVMCSHGATGIKRVMLGSVAQKVARHSTVPVLFLRQDGSVPISSYPDHFRPLHAVMAIVALDGSALAEASLLPAASLVMALAAPARGSLQLTRVVKLPIKVNESAEPGKHTYPESMDLHAKDEAIREAKTYLGNLVNHLRQGPLKDADLTLTWSVAIGKDVAETLIRTAETGEDAEGSNVFGGCDLMVLATHGRGGLERWVLGSVTEHILGATRLPMLIVRAKEQHAKTATASMQIEAR